MRSGVDARLGDHAAVADQHDTLEAEALLELVDLRRRASRDRRCCLRTPRPRPGSRRRAQQAEDDLQLAVLAVATVAEPAELAAASLQLGRRHVVEHQRAVLQVLARQAVSIAGCARRASRARRRARSRRPAQSQPAPRLEAGGVAIAAPARSRAGGRIDQAHDDHGGDEIADAVGAAEQAVPARSDAGRQARRRHGRAVLIPVQAAHHNEMMSPAVTE